MTIARGGKPNAYDLTANVQVQHSSQHTLVNVRSKLVDKDQSHPPEGETRCELSYIFTKDKVILKYKVNSNNDKIKFILPLISSSAEKFTATGKETRIFKRNAVLELTSDHEFHLLPTPNTRIFNFVPGLEAIPLVFDSANAVIEIRLN